ncbi:MULTISPECIES: hypothetical protein [Halorussus]|uniref:hypothetical protein n=1 Tax=Halorussus TaxID=1070314 RepID=UPI000E2133C2|nr:MULTISPECIES: hypothetical protein [Halorussus]NHN61254.1 hypothetical protein [Halorussus sp. JP-T4]
MRTLAAALVALLVGASVAAAVPAATTGDAAPREIPEKRDAQTGDAPHSTDPEAHAGDSGPSDALAGDSPEVPAVKPPELPQQWRRTYGGSSDDMFADAVRTDDGGYLLAGWTGEDRDGWVLKVDGDGLKQWSKTLGGPGTDRFWGLAKTDDGYLLAGRTDADGAKGWAVEVGPDGEVRSNRTLGTGAFYAVERRTAGNATDYLLAGWTYGDGARAGWTVGLSADLSTAWEASHATPESHGDGYLRAVVPTDSGYYLAGKAVGDTDDGWALRLAADGSREWQSVVGGPSRDDVWAAAPASRDGNASAGFVLAGETESDSTGPRDGWVVKFGADGEVAWERRPGGEGTQWLDSAMRTEEGYLFTGGSDAGPKASADGYVVTTDAAGETRWETYVGTDGWDKPWPAIRAHDGGYLFAGQTGGAGADGRDGWLVRVGGSTGEADNTPTPPDDGNETTTGDTTPGSNTTNEAMRGDTATATASSDGPVPGFGFGTALVALLAAALLAGALVAARR